VRFSRKSPFYFWGQIWRTFVFVSRMIAFPGHWNVTDKLLSISYECNRSRRSDASEAHSHPFIHTYIHARIHYYYYYYYYYYGSTILCWALAAFSVSWSYTQLVELLWRGISPSQVLYLHTEQHKDGINAHNTDIHVLSGIRTHDHSVRANEDSSCLRLRGCTYTHT
jgi:hypothetical protein